MTFEGIERSNLEKLEAILRLAIVEIEKVKKANSPRKRKTSAYLNQPAMQAILARREKSRIKNT